MQLPRFLARFLPAPAPQAHILPTGLPSGPIRIHLGDLREDGNSYLTGLRHDSFLDGLVNGGASTLSGGGWMNPVTGLGTPGRDKVMQGSFVEAAPIDHHQLTALFNGNDIAQRIVSAKPKEMFRRGWVLTLPGGPKDAAAKIKAAADLGAADLAPKPGDPAEKPANPIDKPAPLGQKNDAADPSATAGESGPPMPQADVIPDPSKAGSDAKPKPGAAGAPEAGQNENADLAKQIELYAEKLGHIPKLQEATIFGRLYGGGILIMGCDDGKDVSEPLDEENIRSVKYLTWIDRRWVYGSTFYTDLGPKFGEVETWQIINPFGETKDTLIHESRVIRFEGAPVDLVMRRRLMGWTLSVLQAPYDTMRQFDQSFQSIANLMSDMSQAVMKIQGLAQMISNDSRTLQTRMQMVDMSRSTSRMVYLDAENEEFKREPTPLTGVAETLEMQMLRLAAAAEMPVAILFGREPSGLNATGDADFRRFYDTIAGDQKQILEPKLNRLYTVICLAKDSPTKGKVPDGGIGFVWHKLYEPSEKEQAEIRFLMAQADDLYINNETLLPEEVAMSRFRSGDLHLDTEIQSDLRRESLKTAKLPPSGAEKAKIDQENKKSELEVKAAGVAAKPGAGPPKPAGPPK